MKTTCAKCGGSGIIGNGPTSFNPQPCDCGVKPEPVKTEEKSEDWQAVPKKKIPLSERLDKISAKIKARHATTVIEMDLMEAFQLGQSVKPVLHTLKDEIAKEYYKVDSYDKLYKANNSLPFVNSIIDVIAQRYARECVKASLEEAADNGYYFDGELKHSVDKSSITDPKNIILL